MLVTLHTTGARARREFLHVLGRVIGGLVALRATSAMPAPAQAAGSATGRFRRVVTGFDAKGKSTIAVDGTPPKLTMYDAPAKYFGYNAWVLRAVPAELGETSDPVVDGYGHLEPPNGGAVVRITTFRPGYLYPMHQTNTVDFGIVLSGEIELGLQTGTTLLRAGDLVVQRGTPHAWRAVGGPSAVAFVLVDAQKGPR